MKYFLLPFGCQMNLSDTERVRTVLQQMGYEPTDNEEEANLLGIVACSVRQPLSKVSVSVILSVSRQSEAI